MRNQDVYKRQVVMVGIGLAGRKYGGSMNDFMTAGKQGTLLLVTGSYIGSHIGNGIVVGGAEYGAVYGIGGMWFGVGAALSYLLFSAVMSRRVYRGNCVTLSDMLEQRYEMCIRDRYSRAHTVQFPYAGAAL